MNSDEYFQNNSIESYLSNLNVDVWYKRIVMRLIKIP